MKVILSVIMTMLPFLVLVFLFTSPVLFLKTLLFIFGVAVVCGIICYSREYYDDVFKDW